MRLIAPFKQKNLTVASYLQLIKDSFLHFVLGKFQQTNVRKYNAYVECFFLKNLP